MKKITFIAMLCLLLGACVQPAVFKDVDYALIKSSHPITSINGSSIDNTYKLGIAAGKNTLRVVYNTYQYDYLCTFKWVAKAGTAYEITDQENIYPLTLYRWYRKNSLWAVRQDPVNPLDCVKHKAQTTNQEIPD